MLSIRKYWSIFLIIFLLLSLLFLILLIIKYQKTELKEVKKNNYPNSSATRTIENIDKYKVSNKNTNNGYPYFSEQLSQTAENQWQLRYFQPIFKSIIEKNNAVFLEAEYTDISNNNKKNVFVFLGGTLSGKKNIPLVPIENNGSYTTPQSVQEIESFFTKNKQIRIQYLQTANNIENYLKSKECTMFKFRECDLAEYVKNNQDEFIKFFKTGNITENVYLVSLFLSKELYAK